MSPHILVVEDEKHLGVGIKYNLEAENYRVTLVEDGPTALRLLQSSGDSIDLIILDLMLPGMSGYAVCETIRDAGMTVPVLMLSARTLAEDRTRGFDVGANQYMSKPFDLDELLSRVNNLLQQSGRRSAGSPKRSATQVTEASFGNVHVNFETHQASVDGKPVRMTPKELKLLKYFIEHEGRDQPQRIAGGSLGPVRQFANARGGSVHRPLAEDHRARLGRAGLLVDHPRCRLPLRPPTGAVGRVVGCQ
jgi:DNA-binding response OmpR family regulator